MTIQQYVSARRAGSSPEHARLVLDDHDRSAKPPTIGRALAHLAEAIQAAKRAGMTCEQAHKHLAVLWSVVPVEDADDGGL